MTRNYVTLIILLLSLPLFAMAKKPDKNVRPNWIDNPKSEYPENLYLSAVGSGDSKSAAENDAIGNLARIFRSEVSAQTIYQERYSELMSGKKIEAVTQTDASKNITVTAKQNLLNIEIGKTWTDPMGRVYALAYLNRMKTAQIYEEKINQNSAQIKSYLQQELNTSDIYKSFALINAANLIHQYNEELLNQLEIISLETKKSLELGYRPTDLKQKMAETSKVIAFCIKVQGDDKDKIKTTISDILSSNGFSVSETGTNIVDAQISYENVDLNQQAKFVRYVLILNIITADGKTLLSISDSGREGHLNVEEARARAMHTMISKLKKDLPKKLFQYFDDLVLAKNN